MQIDGALGSRISKTFDRFPIHLYEAIVIDGRTLVPAGASGWGEVVHAKKAGGSGAAGELVLAARVLTVDGRELHLRSLRLGGSGENHNQAATTLAAVAGLAGAVGGWLMKGSEVDVPSGTIAGAKVAEDFAVAESAVTPQAPPAVLVDTKVQSEGTKQ
ncbi:hypothetical protein GCM10011614_08330 [Novosphingobium colocasiae]|uniref:Uncharacterized protein n=1 Tax=Novosphingobium colocasiae TaxID=1256513 RepID=A0A918PB28_9SPHN|nr:hypothetical protein GCM10011614_08330 [Novosphingobium colocasiae]